MLVCLDAHYRETAAVAAGVYFADWRDSSAVEEVIRRIPLVEPYRPGEFFRRELPCLLRVLDGTKHDLECAIVDGYVWLDARGGRGLGAHLHRALGGRVPVIGVAKSRFRRETPAVAVVRGRSRRPLYVSAAGMDERVAAERIKSMHGAFRLPTLLKRADELCRSGFPPVTSSTS